MVLSDFNLITKVFKKNQGNINLHMMGRFNSVINELELIDYPLVGRNFTGSNKRDSATMTRIDRILVSQEWESKFTNYQMTPASSSSSDHCPLTLRPMETKHYKWFRFEACWLRKEGFLDVVKKAWTKPVSTSDRILALHIKMSRTTKSVRAWHKADSKKARVLSALANDIIFT